MNEAVGLREGDADCEVACGVLNVTGTSVLSDNGCGALELDAGHIGESVCALAAPPSELGVKDGTQNDGRGGRAA